MSGDTATAPAVERAALAWANACPAKPRRVEAGFLGKTDGLALQREPTRDRRHPYILGGYRAELGFRLTRRLIAADSSERLAADEELAALAAWMAANVPAPPEDVTRWGIAGRGAASPVGFHDSGAEDHTIPFTIFYEVI